MPLITIPVHFIVFIVVFLPSSSLNLPRAETDLAAPPPALVNRVPELAERLRRGATVRFGVRVDDSERASGRAVLSPVAPSPDEHAARPCVRPRGQAPASSAMRVNARAGARASGVTDGANGGGGLVRSWCRHPLDSNNGPTLWLQARDGSRASEWLRALATGGKETQSSRICDSGMRAKHIASEGR